MFGVSVFDWLVGRLFDPGMAITIAMLNIRFRVYGLGFRLWGVGLGDIAVGQTRTPLF